MTFQDLLEQINNRDSDISPGDVVVPPMEIVAFNIRCTRAMMQLKKEALAHMAGVSVSTIERVERAEKVSDESLDKIATAFGEAPGYYTAPRPRISRPEAAEQIEDKFGYMEPVDVAPLRTQRQVRMLASCHAYLVNRPGVGDEFDGDIENLVEWIDLISYLCSETDRKDKGAYGRRRELYQDTLRTVTDLEGRGATVLAGVLPAPQAGISDWKVGVLSITMKTNDPAAIKRRILMVDRRCVEGSPLS